MAPMMSRRAIDRPLVSRLIVIALTGKLTLCYTSTSRDGGAKWDEEWLKLPRVISPRLVVHLPYATRLA